MARQFETLFPHLKDMTDEQLQQNIIDIRHRKTIERPAAAHRAEKAAKPERTRKISKVSKLVETMSEEERLKLIALLEENNDE